MKTGMMVLWGSLVLATAACATESVIHHPNPAESLEQRWQWALERGSKHEGSKGFFVVYSIQRLMSENSYVSNGSCFSGNISTSTTLYGIISGQPTDTNTAVAAQKALERIKRSGRTDIKVMKDLAIIAKFGTERVPIDLSVCNMELGFEFNDLPVFWLGPAENDQSFTLLSKMFGDVEKEEMQKNLVTAIGVHQSTGQSFRFLSSVLQGQYSTDIREEAAFWIGEQHSQEALGVLQTTARNDNSGDVREKATYAISQIGTQEATDALIGLARHARDSGVRRAAVWGLAQSVSRNATSAVEDIASDDVDTEVQKQALFALARMESNDGVATLINIARTHPKPAIRKQAIMCLAQSDDSRALDAIVQILKGR